MKIRVQGGGSIRTGDQKQGFSAVLLKHKICVVGGGGGRRFDCRGDGGQVMNDLAQARLYPAETKEKF